MRISIDLETECAVASCPDHGKAMCRNGHSLSPWHSRITVVGLVSDKGHRKVFRGIQMLKYLWAYLKFLYQEWKDSGTLAPFEIGGQAMKFDWLHLAARDCVIPLEWWTWDSQLAAYVLTEKIPDHYIEELKAKAPPGKHRFGKHSLKTLAPYFLGVEPFWEVWDKDSDEYVLKDAKYALDLVSVLEAKLKDRGEFQFYKEKQLEWAKMLVQAELRGVCVDMEALTQKEYELTQKRDDLKAKLDEQWADAHQAYREDREFQLHMKYESMAARAGKPVVVGTAIQAGSRHEKLWLAAREKLPQGVDYDSPKQMAWLLRDHLGYDIQSLEGDESTGREVLERLAEEGKEDVRTFLEWRKVNKLLTAFIPTYKELTVDGVIHPIYNPDSTRTGRTSSERPNMQQVPPALRPIFKPRPGYKFIGYDAAAIEAKLIALYSEDPALFEIIKTGVSLHDYNTKVFFGFDTPIDQVKKEHPNERAASKNVGFALFYNAGFNRIRIAFAQKGYHLSDHDCKQIHKRFKDAYKTAMDYSKSIVEWMEQGNTLDNLLSRPLKIHNQEDAYMTAFNTLIQSSASDYLLHGAKRAWDELKAAGIDAVPVMFIHDFCGYEVEESRVEEADQIIKNSLTNFDLRNALGPIKLEVEGGVMSRWEK